MLYEVVCTESYLDVGLLIETNSEFKPKRVLGRASTYRNDSEYGGVETLNWIHTGVLLSKKEWIKISYNKDTDKILYELGIVKRNKEKDNMNEVVWKAIFEKYIGDFHAIDKLDSDGIIDHNTTMELKNKLLVDIIVTMESEVND